jgi:hypothetical protein
MCKVCAARQGSLRLERDCVCNQTTTGGKVCPASVEEVIVADASSDEDRIWRPQACIGGGRTPFNDTQRWYPEPRGILPDSNCPVLSRFERNAGARWMNTHPLDTDRSGTGSDIPEGLVW